MLKYLFIFLLFLISCQEIILDDCEINQYGSVLITNNLAIEVDVRLEYFDSEVGENILTEKRHLLKYGGETIFDTIPVGKVRRWIYKEGTIDSLYNEAFVRSCERAWISVKNDPW
jgi:hypothetical protein